ncbi:hypothetical protein QMK19_35145 [Streptomyces sp. H10-C2]|uniref:hypothetical protein n=1 Tax=unclassified Streptomyces TaxID=2593676 RepID=UPI0024B9C687|nr:MULTISPECIES: hypothetical protein [unclassified Streptomyces]MDJ0345871.1 hypothetical protein [Streptomyces sp. PH10-H1]MDJ0374720.1 hypothetical protein [Streptomyces sp. H10-C2]
MFFSNSTPQGHMLALDEDGTTIDFIGKPDETMRARMVIESVVKDSVESVELTAQITVHFATNGICATDQPNHLANALAALLGVEIKTRGIVFFTGPSADEWNSALMSSATLCALYDQISLVAESLCVELSHQAIA